ncbi:MAG: O-antigen ligase family protein [Candidatus Omnitrophota bacterium]
MFETYLTEFKREWSLIWPPDAPIWERRLLTTLFLSLAVVFFLVPAGRFYFSFLFVKISTGYNAYKLFPFPLAVWLIWRWKRPRRWRIHLPIVFPALLFFLLSILAAAGSPDAYQAISESLEIAFYIIFSIMLLDLPWSHRAVKWAAGGFVLGHFYLGLTALYQLLFSGTPRINATFDHPNALAAYAPLSLSLLLWIFDRSQTSKQRTGVLAAIGCVLFGALFSFSRSAYVGLLIFGFVFYYAYPSAAPKIPRRAWAIFFAAAILVAASAMTRFSSTIDELTMKEKISRLTIWPFVMDLCMPSSPFFGIGLGPVQREAALSIMASAPMELPIATARHPHSLYLDLLISMGIPGLLSFLWLAYEAFRQTAWDRTIAAAALRAGLAGFLVQEIFDPQLLNGNIPVALFVLFALGSYSAIQRQTNIENE